MQFINSSSSPVDYIVKLVIVGESGVGKTSLLTRFCENEFLISHITTIGVDFEIKTFHLDGKIAKLQIWDTAGQDRFRNVTSSYYRGAHGVLILFDISDRNSFLNLQIWINDVNKYVTKNTKVMIVGNKRDLVNKREVSKQEAELLAKKNGMSYFETSAKESDKSNVDNCFLSLIREYIKTIPKLENSTCNTTKNILH